MPCCSLCAAMAAARLTGPSRRRPEGDRAFEHITLHRQLSVLLTQPRQLRALVLAQRAVPLTPPAPVQHHPVTQGSLVNAQVPGHLRDRLAGLPDNPDRALPEILIELPP